MEVSGQLHAPAASPPGKEPLKLIFINVDVNVTLFAVEKIYGYNPRNSLNIITENN
jgi:hypothetical protein